MVFTVYSAGPHDINLPESYQRWFANKTIRKSMLVTHFVQVHEYGLAIICASYRRLACADAQRMLGLQGTVPDQQLIVLLEALGNRCCMDSCASAKCILTFDACGMCVTPGCY
jgi:hypothetical protein